LLVTADVNRTMIVTLLALVVMTLISFGYCDRYVGAELHCVFVLKNVSAFVEKPVEVSKSEWIESLQRLQVTRTDMNRLVMNYLVTGMFHVVIFRCVSAKKSWKSGHLLNPFTAATPIIIT